METIAITIPQIVGALFVSAGIPSAAVGFVVWIMQRKIMQRDKQREEDNQQYRKEREKKERDREQLELHLIETVNATLSLAEATAKAVQRIPDAHCNGDMHAALEYAETTKRKQKTFLTQKGVRAII